MKEKNVSRYFPVENKLYTKKISLPLTQIQPNNSYVVPRNVLYELQIFVFQFTVCNYHNGMNFFLTKLILSEESHDAAIC